jgi:hypothetical protein
VAMRGFKRVYVSAECLSVGTRSQEEKGRSSDRYKERDCSQEFSLTSRKTAPLFGNKSLRSLWKSTDDGSARHTEDISVCNFRIGFQLTIF